MEYRCIYSRFADPIAVWQGDADIAPLRIVPDAFMSGHQRRTEPCNE